MGCLLSARTCLLGLLKSGYCISLLRTGAKMFKLGKRRERERRTSVFLCEFDLINKVSCPMLISVASGRE